MCANATTEHDDFWLHERDQVNQAERNVVGDNLPGFWISNFAGALAKAAHNCPSGSKIFPGFELARVVQQHLAAFAVGHARLNFLIHNKASANAGANGYV